MLVLELFFLLDEVPTHILLAEAVDDSIDAHRVNVGITWLGLEHILAEEVVLARDDPIVLQVKYLLGEVLPLSVGVQCKVARVKGQVVEPLFGRKVLVNGSEGAA